MIVVVSSDHDDSTKSVRKWLKRWEKKVIRLGQEQFIAGINLHLNNQQIGFTIRVGDTLISFAEIEAFWYRKYLLDVLTEKLTLEVYPFEPKNDYLDYLENTEKKCLVDYLVFLLEKKKFVGNYHAKDGNKLINFHLAKQCGLNIPATYVSTEKASLRKFASQQACVLKPIQDLYHFVKTESSISNYIDLMDEAVFENSKDTIFPSCLQFYIEKKIEIRSFYLHEQIYSMAIFSQSDERTKIDFRNYNDDNPNRNLPYQLPEEIEAKIRKLMKMVQLNTGSLDLILTPQNEYYF
jgi:ATP-GRASP peptide maturase of grasp-with-spasm system